MRFQNGSYKVAIELQVVQFWSETIFVISNRTRAARSLDVEIRPNFTPLSSITTGVHHLITIISVTQCSRAVFLCIDEEFF